MVLFQLPYRRLVFLEPSPPDLSKVSSLHVIMFVKLSPDDYFGDAELSGRLRLLPEHVGFSFGEIGLRGLPRFRPNEGARLRKFEYAGLLSGCKFTMDGATARLEFHVESRNDLGGIIQTLIEFLPSSFAAASSGAISIVSIDGTADGVPFDVRFKGIGPGGGVMHVGEVNPRVAEYWDVVMPVMFELPRKLVSAHRYLAQSFLLDSASEFSYEFRGERILNLCKALEAVVPNNIVDSIDGIRSYLRGWGLNHEEVEVFASIKYLRSELDSAHVSISPLTEEAHHAVSDFMYVAEKAIQALIITAVKKWIADRALYPIRKVGVKEPSVIRHLEKYKKLEIPDDWA